MFLLTILNGFGAGFGVLEPLPGEGGGGLHVSYVPMREQKKKMSKGTFFEVGSAQRCHHLG